MSVVMADSQIGIKKRDLKQFPRKVADTVFDIVNNHGVRYRIQTSNGGHIYLYDGKKGSRPYKISASRPAETSMSFLVKWIEQNVPDYGKQKSEAVVEKLFRCTYGCDLAFETPEEINVHYDEQHQEGPTAASVLAEGEIARAGEDDLQVWESEEEVEYGWEPFIFSTGRKSEWFVVKGRVLKCTYPDCDYQKEGHFGGVHLHEASHSEEKAEWAKRSAVTRREKLKANQVRDALNLLASTYGFSIMAEQDAGELEELQTEVEALRKENEGLRTELGEVQSKLHLIQEAMGL